MNNNKIDQLISEHPVEFLLSEKITISPFTIKHFGVDSFWIKHEGGEGMETSPKKLISLLYNFWYEEF